MKMKKEIYRGQLHCMKRVEVECVGERGVKGKSHCLMLPFEPSEV